MGGDYKPEPQFIQKGHNSFWRRGMRREPPALTPIRARVTVANRSAQEPRDWPRVA